MKIISHRKFLNVNQQRSKNNVQRLKHNVNNKNKQLLNVTTIDKIQEQRKE